MQDNNRPVPPEGYILRYDNMTGKPYFVKAPGNLPGDPPAQAQEPAEMQQDIQVPTARTAADRPDFPPMPPLGPIESEKPDSDFPPMPPLGPIQNEPCNRPLSSAYGNAADTTGRPCGADPFSQAASPAPVPFGAHGEKRAGKSCAVLPRQCAGFFTRLAAYLVDFAVAGILAFLVGLLLKMLSGALGGALEQPVFFHYDTIDLVKYLITALYFILLTKMTGWTLGKRLLRVRVVSADGAPLRWLDVIYRETIGRYLSSLLCVGYMVLALDRQHRGFHDMLCDTRVVYLESTEALS